MVDEWGLPSSPPFHWPFDNLLSQGGPGFVIHSSKEALAVTCLLEGDASF